MQTVHHAMLVYEQYVHMHGTYNKDTQHTHTECPEGLQDTVIEKDNSTMPYTLLPICNRHIDAFAHACKTMYEYVCTQMCLHGLGIRGLGFRI